MNTTKEHILKSSIIEAIGTFFLVLFGCGAILINESTGGTIGYVGIALTFGFVVMAMVFAVGHVSGGHINPAVTIAFACAKKFPWQKVLPYICGQVIGAILAAVVLKYTIASGHSLGVTKPAHDVWQAFVMEFITSAALMFVVMSLATDMRATNTMAAVAIGATITLDALVGGAISGASMNPARSLGPALVAMQLDHIWVYIVAPIIGAVLGGFVYIWASDNRI